MSTTVDRITNISRHEMIFAHADVLSEGCIGSVHSLFVENTVVTVENGIVCFYHLKTDQIPTTLQAMGVTDGTIAQTVFGWWEYAMQNGLCMTIEEVFPQHWYSEDFVKEDRLQSMGITATAAELNVLNTDIQALTGVDASTLTTLTGLLAQDGTLQQNINAKQDILTGATSALVTSDLGADFVVISDGTGKIVASAVSSTTLSFLDTTASVQSLLNLKTDQSALVAEQTARTDADAVLQTNINAKADTVNVETKVDATAKLTQALAAVDAEKLRLDTLLDVPTLNEISEVVTAYELAIENADDVLEVLIGQKVSQAAYNTKIGLLDDEDTALKTRATDLETGQALKADLSVVYTQSAANTLLADKEDNLSSGQLLVLAGEVYSTTEKAKVTANDLKVGFTQALVSQNTDVVANVLKRSYPTTEEIKVDSNTTVLAGKTAAQLGSLDTTTSLVQLLAAKEPTVTYGISQGSVLKVTGSASDGKFAQFNSTGLVSRTDQNVRDDLSLYSQTEVDAKDALKCTKAGDESWTGSKQISKDGIGVQPLELQNSSTDQTVLKCNGSDGSFEVQGGNVVNFSRNGGCYIRAPAAGANILVQTRGATRCTFSDKTEVAGRLDAGSLYVNGTQIDTNGGGSSAITQWTIPGSSETLNESLDVPHYTLSVPGANYYFDGNSHGSSGSYCRMPDYDTVPIGTYFRFYNGCSQSLKISTWQYGEDNTTSTDQRISDMTFTGNGVTQVTVPSSERFAYLVLLKRESGWEDWLVMQNN